MTYFVIRNQHSGLVLDATDYHVKLQHFTGFPSQLWKLDHIGLGRFFITNKANGKLLDIEEGAKIGNNIITFGKQGGVNQQWYIHSDGAIVSAGGNIGMDVSRQNFSPGNRIVAFSKHGGASQKFQLQYQ